MNIGLNWIDDWLFYKIERAVNSWFDSQLMICTEIVTSMLVRKRKGRLDSLTLMQLGVRKLQEGVTERQILEPEEGWKTINPTLRYPVVV